MFSKPTLGAAPKPAAKAKAGGDTPKNALFTRKKTLQQAKENKAFAKAAASHRNRPKHKRLYDEQINRALKTHFEDFVSKMVDNYVPDGASCSLREAITAAMFPDADQAEPNSLAPQLITKLRLKYATGEICEWVLRELPTDKQERLASELNAACQAACHPNMNQRKRNHLSGLLPSLKNLNDREVRTILRCLCGLKPQVHGDLASFTLKIMQCAYRENWHQKHPLYLRSLMHVFENALKFFYRETQSLEESLHYFWKKYGQYVALFSESKFQDISTLVNARGHSYAGVLPLLNRTAESGLGKLMFGWALPEAFRDHIKGVVNFRLGELPENQLISQADIDNCIKNSIMDLSSNEMLKKVLWKKTRDIHVKYRDWSVSLVVNSVEEEVRIRVHAWVKTNAVGAGVQLLSFEEAFFPLSDEEGDLECFFEADVLRGMNLARERVDKTLRSVNLSDADVSSIKQYLLKKKSVWQFDDQIIEIILLDNICGATGVRRIESMILNALPQVGQKMAVAEAYDKLERITQQHWYTFAPSEGKTIMTTMMDFLYDLKMERKPEGTEVLDTTEFDQQCKEKLGSFVVFENAIEVCFGQDALLKSLDLYAERLANKDVFTLSDLTAFSIFEWLLPSEDQDRAHRLRQHILDHIQRLEEDSEEGGAEEIIAPFGTNHDDEDPEGDDSTFFGQAHAHNSDNALEDATSFVPPIEFGSPPAPSSVFEVKVAVTPPRRRQPKASAPLEFPLVVESSVAGKTKQQLHPLEDALSENQIENVAAIKDGNENLDEAEERPPSKTRAPRTKAAGKAPAKKRAASVKDGSHTAASSGSKKAKKDDDRMSVSHLTAESVSDLFGASVAKSA